MAKAVVFGPPWYAWSRAPALPGTSPATPVRCCVPVIPNAIPPAALSFRDKLNDEEFNRSLRPYPQYNGFDLYSSYPLGRYQRDAGFVRVEKRASMGLSLSAYYEFSKQMDDYSGPYGIQ